jgi:hypothetical protein
MIGWLAAWERSPEQRFLDATSRAARWLLEEHEPDGLWQRGNSRFALSHPTLYNSRVAWALAEAGATLDDVRFTEAARRNLLAVGAQVADNGWIPNCCLTDPEAPLLHTLAYAIRGLVEGGRVLGDEAIATAGARAARALMCSVGPDGRMSGRFDRAWNGVAQWSCLTGQVQMANNWMRLHLISGDASWLEPVPSVIGFVKSTQNRTSRDAGLRGGIKGSWPVDGGYGRFELLNWATKYFVDALIRAMQIAKGTGGARAHPFRLA